MAVWALSLLPTDVSTRRLTPINQLCGIRSLSVISTTGCGHHTISALPPLIYYKASPKAISERTSYFRVRLEFHPYPQVIQTLFNVFWFGPPVSFT